MTNHLSYFQDTIDKLKNQGNYRVFNDILRERGDFPQAIWYGPYSIKNIINWCSNDYLGMGQNKVVIDAMHTASNLHCCFLVRMSQMNGV